MQYQEHSALQALVVQVGGAPRLHPQIAELDWAGGGRFEGFLLQQLSEQHRRHLYSAGRRFFVQLARCRHVVIFRAQNYPRERSPEAAG